MVWFKHPFSYTHSDFFTFWLAGKLNWTGQDPYAEIAWRGGHHQFGSPWIPNPIFPYPLPLAIFLTPLGLLSFNQAFAIWIYLAINAVVASGLILLSIWEQHPKIKHFILPIFAGILLFRPFIVSLNNGQLSPFLTLMLVLTVYWWEKKQWGPGSIVLALTVLKPTLGLPIIGLSVIWLARQRNFTALWGIALTFFALFVIAWLRNPAWVMQFLAGGSKKLSSTFGYSPNLWGLGGAICSHEASCTVTAGLLMSTALVCATIFIIVRQYSTLAPATILSLIIPTALLITPYIWVYDQLLLVIPLVVSMMKLLESGYPYLLSALIFVLMAILTWLLLALAAWGVGYDYGSAIIPLLSWLLVMVVKEVKK